MEVRSECWCKWWCHKCLHRKRSSSAVHLGLPEKDAPCVEQKAQWRQDATQTLAKAGVFVCRSTRGFPWAPRKRLLMPSPPRPAGLIQRYREELQEELLFLYRELLERDLDLEGADRKEWAKAVRIAMPIGNGRAATTWIQMWSQRP